MPVLISCANQTTVKQQETERIEQVQTMVLKDTTVGRITTFSAILQGYETMDIAPSLTGHIEHIYVDVADRVAKGDTLVRMDRMQYNTAKLTFSNLKIEMQRMEALHESGAVSQQAYDQIKLSYGQAKENYEFLASNTFVKAQFPGVISAKNYEDGELYSGKAILTLTRMKTLKTYINIPETYFPVVHKGMKLDIVSDIYRGETFPGVIEIVYPTIDAASHTFVAKVRIPNGGERLRAGMYVHVTLSMGQETALLIPYQAVLKLLGSNERYVFINDGGVAKQVFVTLGQRFDDRIEISSDSLHIGDELVYTGQAKLVDGVKLNVVK